LSHAFAIVRPRKLLIPATIVNEGRAGGSKIKQLNLQQRNNNMKHTKFFSLSAAALAAGATLTASSVARADFLSDLFQGGVPLANERSNGVVYSNVIAPGLVLSPVATGTDPLENPSGLITRFGYLNDGATQPIEPSKTEPDENTYVFLPRNPRGPTPGYNYGHRFLFQGHENANDLAYITRINLDVLDPAHRITLMTPLGADGKTHFNRIDGSTWNPFTQTLLFTQENGNAGGIIELSATWPPVTRTLHGILGQGGYEGIHPDDQGNLLIFEDVGGTGVNIDPADTNSVKAARNPNSFVYRFLPNNRADLSAGGRLQALQVSIDGAPVSFVPVNAANPTGDVFSDNQLKLHTPGTSWPCHWVTVHDTSVDGTADFNANARAKAAGATPFKRPENGVFHPGARFLTFFFDATGDTDARSGNVPALAARGAWGSIFRVDFDSTRNSGTISLFFLGDAAHAAFDNLAFADNRVLLATEDRGDNLHRQLNALDSVWAFDVQGNSAPVRFLALGRDPSSTIDSLLLGAGTPGFQNDGDNEPTGLHISNGLIPVPQLLGGIPSVEPARWFITQQHGDNTVFEILSAEDEDDQGED
jgi:hypothetical protein